MSILDQACLKRVVAQRLKQCQELDERGIMKIGKKIKLVQRDVDIYHGVFTDRQSILTSLESFLTICVNNAESEEFNAQYRRKHFDAVRRLLKIIEHITTDTARAEALDTNVPCVDRSNDAVETITTSVDDNSALPPASTNSDAMDTTLHNEENLGDGFDDSNVSQNHDTTRRRISSANASNNDSNEDADVASAAVSVVDAGYPLDDMLVESIQEPEIPPQTMTNETSIGRSRIRPPVPHHSIDSNLKATCNVNSGAFLTVQDYSSNAASKNGNKNSVDEPSKMTSSVPYERSTTHTSLHETKATNSDIANLKHHSQLHTTLNQLPEKEDLASRVDNTGKQSLLHGQRTSANNTTTMSASTIVLPSTNSVTTESAAKSTPKTVDNRDEALVEQHKATSSNGGRLINSRWGKPVLADRSSIPSANINSMNNFGTNNDTTNLSRVNLTHEAKNIESSLTDITVAGTTASHKNDTMKKYTSNKGSALEADSNIQVSATTTTTAPLVLTESRGGQVASSTEIDNVSNRGDTDRSEETATKMTSHASNGNPSSAIKPKHKLSKQQMKNVIVVDLTDSPVQDKRPSIPLDKAPLMNVPNISSSIARSPLNPKNVLLGQGNTAGNLTDRNSILTSDSIDYSSRKPTSSAPDVTQKLSHSGKVMSKSTNGNHAAVHDQQSGALLQNSSILSHTNYQSDTDIARSNVDIDVNPRQDSSRQTKIGVTSRIETNTLNNKSVVGNEVLNLSAITNNVSKDNVAGLQQHQRPYNPTPNLSLTFDRHNSTPNITDGKAQSKLTDDCSGAQNKSHTSPPSEKLTSDKLIANSQVNNDKLVDTVSAIKGTNKRLLHALPYYVFTGDQSTQPPLPFSLPADSKSSVYSKACHERKATIVKFQPRRVDRKDLESICMRCQLNDPYWKIEGILHVGRTSKSITCDANVLKSAAEMKLSIFSGQFDDNTKRALTSVKPSSWGKSAPYKNGDFRVILKMFPVRAITTGKRADCHLWPKSTFMMVNNNPVRLMQRKQESHKLDLWTGLCDILDVTALMSSAKHQLTIKMACYDSAEYYYMLSVCRYMDWKEVSKEMIETSRMSPYLIPKLSRRSSEKLIAKFIQDNSLNLDGDKSITKDSGKIIFSLLCMVTKKAIVTPVRGKDCKHWQCIDLDNFLSINSRVTGSRWRCPACENFISFSDLKVCGLTADLLQEFKSDLTASRNRIEYCDDGSYLLLDEETALHSYFRKSDHVKRKHENETTSDDVKRRKVLDSPEIVELD